MGRLSNFIQRLFGAKEKEVSQFNYTLQDLLYWVIKRKDGTTVKYIYSPEPGKVPTVLGPSGGSSSGSGLSTARGGYHWGGGSYQSLSTWCKHTPLVEIFDAPPRREGMAPIKLYVNDASDARTNRYKFDMIVDGGDVLSPEKAPLIGDEELVKALMPFTIEYSVPRLLKLDWIDRMAPDVVPAFWPALVERLEGKVMTCCQGGHGRSGTAAVAIMMCLTDYTPLQAITHLRALHCPRAIESKDQHEYLDSLAKALGREQDAAAAEEVPNFKEAFLKMDSKWAKPYQERIKL